MSNFTALYDACVIYPMPLCDLLLQLALTGTFRAKWSDEIHKEWIRTTKNKRPDISTNQIERKRAAIDVCIKDALVKNYNRLIHGLELPDPNDRHVLAAAIASNTDVIVTYNLKDFPENKLKPWGIEAQHPDDFIAHLIDLYPGAVCWAAKMVRARLQNPALTVEQYFANLQALGLTKTTAALAEYAATL